MILLAKKIILGIFNLASGALITVNIKEHFQRCQSLFPRLEHNLPVLSLQSWSCLPGEYLHLITRFLHRCFTTPVITNYTKTVHSLGTQRELLDNNQPLSVTELREINL